ncbi:MAG: hypothetical protein ABI947_04785 [Chloroflexota bacterium]
MFSFNRYSQWLLTALVVSLSMFSLNVDSRIMPVQAKQMDGPMSAAWSPDGKLILMTIVHNEDMWSLYVLNVSSGTLTKIADNALTSAWSPDGKQIVYATDTNGVVVINADGTLPQKIASAGYSPTWSPDSKEVRFLLYDSIARVPIGSKAVQRVTEQKKQNFVYYEWSPDQQQIAYTTFADNAPNTVYLMNADGSSLRKLAESTSGGDIAWSPDGKHLATVSDCDKGHGLCVWDADGSNPHKINDYGENPQWSPDSEQLAYVQGGKICVVNSDGSNQHCLTQDYTGSRPFWSPDGTQLMFIATTITDVDKDMKMVTKLNVVNADGTGFKQLVP